MSPRLLLVVAAVLFSTGGAAIKYNQLTSWQVACFRAAFAAGALWIAIPGVRRRWSWTLFWVGCAYASMLVMFVAATKLTTAANAIFLQSTAPIYLLFIGPVVLKEPLRRSDVMLLVLMGIGMSLFFVGSETPLATAPNPRLGNLLGAATGLAWGLTVTGLRWAGRKDPTGDTTIAAVFAGNVIAFFVALIPSFPVETISTRDVLVVFYLGTCQIALAYYCVSKAVRHLSALETAVILLVEPALNPVWAWLILGERPAILACVGGAILLAATIVNARWQSPPR